MKHGALELIRNKILLKKLGYFFFHGLQLTQTLEEMEE